MVVSYLIRQYLLGTYSTSAPCWLLPTATFLETSHLQEHQTAENQRKDPGLLNSGD
jgi:hypothetical protein